MNDYFNEELQARIREMKDGEMNALLLSLESTPSWIAILKYLQLRMISAQNGLLTLDPIAKATDLCRLQGTLAGLSDLQNAVIMLKAASEKVIVTQEE